MQQIVIRLIFFQQEKYMEIVLAKETKRIAEDMQLRDLKVKKFSIGFSDQKFRRLATSDIKTGGKYAFINRSIRQFFTDHSISK